MLASALVFFGFAGAANADTGSPLERLAAAHPDRTVEVIAQLREGVSPLGARSVVAAHDGRVTKDLHIINGFGAQLDAADALELVDDPRVEHVSLNAAVEPQAIDTRQLQTAYPPSAGAPSVWNQMGYTGKGVGVAIVDTGIDGSLPDFQVSKTDTTSRVVASVVTNPLAKNVNDEYGHGTHVAGILAGNGTNRSDTLAGRYIGTAPEANLISIKADDGAGNATILDVIYGIQFAVDHKDTYNIRVLNLSLESTVAQSYKTDPLDAAVESAWLKGIVVVAAAGNRGTAKDAVSYAPGNDPFVISVGAVNDGGTTAGGDDVAASWSSRGTTQDGFAKPDILAPGASIVSTLAPNSAFTKLCSTCVVSGQYFRAGGTSMAAPVVSGVAAMLIEKYPNITPNQVKGMITALYRTVPGALDEVAAGKVLQANPSQYTANQGLTPNTLVSSTTGDIDYTRSSWSRSSWSTAPEQLIADWARSSWSCNCSLTSSGSVDPTRSSWSRSSWSTSWKL